MPRNCPPPFPPYRPPLMPRPEPFTPTPRRCPSPDPIAWIKVRLAAISRVIPKEASPDNLLADRGWVVGQTGGKADKAPDPTAGNLAALDAQGNPVDSGKKPADFQAKLTFDTTPTAGSQNPVTSEGIKSAIATAAATNTANFLGTYSYVTDLGFTQPSSAADVDNAAIATALGGLAFAQTPTNNDYVFVSINYTPTTDVDEFRRFKFNDTLGTWAYEYTLNNSSFTAEQWAAISSGITSGLVAKLGALPTAEALAQALAGKFDKSGGVVTGPVLINSTNSASSPLTLGFNTDPTNIQNTVDILRSNDGGIYLRIHDTTLASQILQKLPRQSGTYAIAASEGHAGNLAALDAQGNPTDSGMASDDVEALLFAQFYPEGDVKSAAEFTSGIKYNDPDMVNRTIAVKPFCNTGTAANDNSNLSGHVVIPPFVDAQGNGYISDDGTRFKVVEVGVGHSIDVNTSLTAIVAPSTVTTIGTGAFLDCALSTSFSLPAATSIGGTAFLGCTSLTDVSLPAAQSIEDFAFAGCTSLTSVDFGDTPRSSVPSLGEYAFDSVPTSCKIIVPYTQYDTWKAASGWSALQQEFVRHAEKADKPATFTTGNLAKFDANGNPMDSGKKPGDFQSALTAQQLASIAAVSNALAFDATHSYAAGDPVVYNGTLYTFTTAHTGAWTGSDVSTVDIIARLAGKLNNTTDTMSGSLTVQGSLTVGSRKDGSVIGTQSTAEGVNTTASGSYSHAEGVGTTASGSNSHAEGNATKASGSYSHAEGAATTASGSYSHAEGNSTTASGSYSHAEGSSTKAQNDYEHAQGKHNASHKASGAFGDAGNTLSSIGFGTSNSARKNAVETMQDGKTFVYGLGGYDGTNPTGSGVLDLASVVNGKADKCVPQTANNLAALTSTGSLADSGWTADDLARYALVTKTISNSSVSLDDRADNYVDARTLGSSDSLDVDFPILVSGKSRDFVLAVECSATPPTISYAAYATIMAEDASALDPEEGMNIYAFTEFKPNIFLASRKLVDTVVVNTPENTDQLLLAIQKRGISTTGITNYGGVETALGLGDTDTPQDAVDAVMN